MSQQLITIAITVNIILIKGWANQGELMHKQFNTNNHNGTCLDRQELTILK